VVVDKVELLVDIGVVEIVDMVVVDIEVVGKYFYI
jgi:hypothetical protein